MLDSFLKEKYNIVNKFDVIVSPNIPDIKIWNETSRTYDILMSYDTFMLEYSVYREKILLNRAKSNLKILKKECEQSVEFFLTVRNYSV